METNDFSAQVASTMQDKYHHHPNPLEKCNDIKIKRNDSNLLHLMQTNDKYYSKLRRINKTQTTNDVKNPRQSEVNKQLITLYDFIDDEFKKFKTIERTSLCFKHKFKKITDPNDKLIHKSLLSSSYIPPNIVKYIREKSRYVLEYKCDIGDKRRVTVYFIIFEDSKFELNNIRKKGASYFKNCILKVYLWLNILAKYADIKCGTNLSSYIYLTPFKRRLPGFVAEKNTGDIGSERYNDYELYEDEYSHNNILRPVNVNGGVSDVCKTDANIIVYRKEEWFKVFIHETMHNYGIDFSLLNITNANKRLQNIFSIKKEIKIYESYCEIWARIMNVFFETYFDINTNKKFSSRTTRRNFLDKLYEPPKSFKFHNRRSDEHAHGSAEPGTTLQLKNKYDVFLKKFYESIQHETIFSLFQCIKVLDYMGLDYNIISTCSDANYVTVNKLYKEETNVFAYYIIVAILLANFNSFILWCIDNNTNIFNFKKDEKNIDEFIKFIYKNYKTNDLLKLIVAIENKLETQNKHNNVLLSTMRMTVIGGGD
jgi:hypothetical protein